MKRAEHFGLSSAKNEGQTLGSSKQLKLRRFAHPNGQRDFPNLRNKSIKSHQAQSIDLRSLGANDKIPIRLGKMRFHGGEGFLYEIQGQKNRMAKLVRSQFATEEYGAKILAMCQNPPSGFQRFTNGLPLTTLAWPEQPLVKNGQIVGFIMPYLSSDVYTRLSTITSKKARRNPDSHTWIRDCTVKKRILIAMDLCRRLSEMHAAGIVCGDLSQNNIMVARGGTVCLVDCDSMQIPNPKGGFFRHFGYTTGYRAPESTDDHIRDNNRTPEEDLFVLAVHIYELILSRHPFRFGQYNGTNTTAPNTVVRITTGEWLGNPNGHFAQPVEQTQINKVLPSFIMDLFSRAFDPIYPPAQRPSCQEWFQALSQLVY